MIAIRRLKILVIVGKNLKDDVVLHDVSIYKHKCGKAFVLKKLMVVAKILSSFCNNI